jgi:transcription initiation factor TFIIB
MTELVRLCDALAVPAPLREAAAVMYRKLMKADLVRGRSVEALIAASLYAVCRLTRTPRTLRAVAGASPRSRREISRSYRLLLRVTDARMPVDDPVKYVAPIASRLHVGQRIQNAAVELLRAAKAQGTVAGKTPVGLAAATLYIACGGAITQGELAAAAGVTAVTIRNRCKVLNRMTGVTHSRASSLQDSCSTTTP